MKDLKNIEKMGKVDFDNDDDFLEEAELPKFDPKKGKNVDSENKKSSIVILEYLETRMARGNLPELTGKAKYSRRPIVN